MVILEITPVEGRFGEFGELAHRVLLKCRCPVCRRMPEKDFLKKVLKSENVFKIFGNIPDVQIFCKKGERLQTFCVCTVWQLFLGKPERFRKFWKYTRCGKFFEKSVSDFRFFAYALYVNRRNF